MAFRALPQLTSRRLAASAPRLSAVSSLRYQSNDSSPKPHQAQSRATAAVDKRDASYDATRLIDLVPGESAASKTGFLFAATLGTSYAISQEWVVGTDEDLLLLSFLVLMVGGYRALREPFANWASGWQDRYRRLLNKGREDHLKLVEHRRNKVGELDDVSNMTIALFDQTRETVRLEAEAYVLRQQAAYDSEIKAVLDSWVRFEQQEREGKQRELVQTVIADVRKQLQDPATQKQILQQAIADINDLVGRKQI